MMVQPPDYFKTVDLITSHDKKNSAGVVWGPHSQAWARQTIPQPPSILTEICWCMYMGHLLQDVHPIDNMCIWTCDMFWKI